MAEKTYGKTSKRRKEDFKKFQENWTEINWSSNKSEIETCNHELIDNSSKCMSCGKVFTELKRRYNE